MWAVKVCNLTNITPIDGANAIECAWINDWPIVVRKGQFNIGDKVVYFPADSIIPLPLLEKMGLVGKLSGSTKNRIKCVKLRNQLSIGLIIHAEPQMNVGDEVSEYYGITRYEAPIPIELRGQMRNLPEYFIKYDVENIRSYPDAFIEGEEVVIMEKLHGSSMSVCWEDNCIVNSRSISLIESSGNTYWEAIKNSPLYQNRFGPNGMYVHGECLPTQDLKYGIQTPSMFVFDVRDKYRWFDFDEMMEFVNKWGISTAPILYRGPYSKEVVEQYTNGYETLSGKNLHIREGCVIRPVKERIFDNRRLILKSISPAYLTRKDGTEYH